MAAEIIIETGALAKQTDGSVVVKMGKAMLLATVVSKKEGCGRSWFFTDVGRFTKRNLLHLVKYLVDFKKMKEDYQITEILISRIVDRAIRPIFPDDYHADTQIASR